jgi:carboxypeptidase Q
MRASGWMVLGVLGLATATVPTMVSRPSANEPGLEAYHEPVARIIAEALGSDFAWRRLAELTDTVGHRLSGSPQLDMAIRWALDGMKKDGLENVRADPVMVPRWVRGSESAEIVRPGRHQLVMLGLGGSVGTPDDGIEAETLVVGSFNDLETKAVQVKGRIVVFNVPFTNYGQTVVYRSMGASRAARLGAVAVLVRSLGPPGYRTPHTGGMSYAEGVPRIPAAAVTVEDAEMLQRHAGRRASENGRALRGRCPVGERRSRTRRP